MSLTKKAFALFLLASLTAGQAQAVTVELTTDKMVEAISQLLQKSGDKVVALLAKEDLSRVVAGLGLTGLFVAISNKLHNEAKKCYNTCDEFGLKLLAADMAILAGMCGTKTVEIIYNA